MKIKANLNSLKGRMGLLVIATVLITIVVATAISLTSGRSTILAIGKENSKHMAESTAAILGRFLDERTADIENAALDPVLSDPASSIEAKRQVLTGLKKSSGGLYREIVMVDNSGRTIAAASDNPKANYSEALWFKEAMQSNGIGSKYYKDNDLGEYVVSFSAPVKTASGQNSGVIAGIIPISYLNSLLSKLSNDMTRVYGAGSYIYVLDSNGVIVWHPNKEKMGVENIGNRTDALGDIARDMIQGKAGIGEYSYEGINKVVGYTPVLSDSKAQSLGWSLASVVNEASLLQPMGQMTTRIGLAGILIVILCPILALLVIRRSLHPMDAVVDALTRIGQGNVPAPITRQFYGEFETIRDSMNNCIAAINNLVADVNMLASEAVEGRLDTRADAGRHQGDFRRVIQGVNETLDAVIGPLNVAAEYIDRISKGDIPPKVTDDFKGDFNEIKNNLNQCIDGLGGLVEAKQVLQKMAVNDYTSRVEGNYLGIFKETADAVNQVQDRMLRIRDININIAAGDLRDLEDLKKVGRRSENDQIVPTFINMMESINYMVEQGVLLTEAIRAGRLDQRADASKLRGSFKQVIEGFNEAIDAVIGPLNVAAEYIDRISKGDIPPKVTDDFKGDFNEIKNNLNQCIDGLGGLVEAKQVLQKMAVNDYTSRVEGNYLGIFKETADAVNQVQDRLLHIQDININIAAGDLRDLEDLKKVGRRSENDHMVPAFINMMESIKIMVDQAVALAQSAREGNLSQRADASQLRGSYQQVILGINETLDAVIAPIQEAAAVLHEMSRGNLQVAMTGNYRGDLALIKDSLNNTITALRGYIGEISRVLNEVARGNLDISISGDFLGDFVEIKNSINLIIDSLNEVLNEINQAANEVASGAAQVSDSSQSLSQASTEQAASVEQITASITQVAAQTKQNALNANQANELALAAKENAVRGDQEMQEMLKSMSEINEASANISKIIKVIDEIAFQTNILALNAAVEAARAGQHGKGFAVVAEEVRNLAARSANAAKETTVLIEGTVEKVEAGTRIANDTATALNRIVEGVTRAADLVGEIARASNEQATAIAQIDQGLTQVSSVTQMNTATAQQSASASQQLASQAELLKDRVSAFKLKKNTASNGVLSGLSPDMLRAIKEILEKNPTNTERPVVENSKMGVAAGGSRIRISLDDEEFGKY